MHSNLTRKGVSSIIGAIIAIAIVLSFLTTVVLFGFGAFNAQQQSIEYARSIELSRQMENIIISYKQLNNRNTLVTITNNGTIRVDLKSLIFRDANDQIHIIDLWVVALNSTQITSAGIYLRNITNGGIYNVTDDNGYVYLTPKGLLSFEINGIMYPISVVTSSGNIIKALVSVSLTGNYSEVAGSTIVYPIDLGTIESIQDRSDIQVNKDELIPPNSTHPGKGIVSDDRWLYVDKEFTNIRLSTNTKFRFGNVLIGYNPEWTRNREGPPKYNILITGPYWPSISDYLWLNPPVVNVISVNGEELYGGENLDDVFPHGWRIKIIGFTPSSDNGLYIFYNCDKYNISISANGSDALGRYYYADAYRELNEPHIYSYLYLNGTAEKIVIYGSEPINGEYEYSYEPFVFSLDIDGNGNPEWVFITEDTDYGTPSTRNDYIFGIPYDDKSIKPFFINLTGYPIRGEDTALVMIAFRMYFHDNLGGDTDEVDYSDKVLLGVYLIDSETGEIASSREFIYQELDDLEDTYPPSQNFFVKTISLIIPNEDKTYFIAFAFQDPYMYDGNHDDGDFTIMIEWLGISFFARP